MSGNKVEPSALSQHAFAILVADLEGYGNKLSDMHRKALHELVRTFADYCAGMASGRKVFGLPTGMGKTSAVVAFIAALHRSGSGVPMAVAASKVEALIAILHDLVAHGVPRELIGLKHAVSNATVPSDSEPRLFQLVTHARVRLAPAMDLLTRFNGEPRRLLIYDESLFKSEVFAVGARKVLLGCGVVQKVAELDESPELTALGRFLNEAGLVIDRALVEAKAGPAINIGIPVELPRRDEATLAAWASLLRAHRHDLEKRTDLLVRFIEMSQEPLQVIPMEQGDGAVAIREAVSPDLRDVVVLDASAPIRELMRMDETIVKAGSFETAQLKSFEAVKVTQLLARGGRNSVERGFAASGRDTAAMARDVADIIRSDMEADPARTFLVFSFKAQMGPDVVKELRSDLKKLGINPDERIPKVPPTESDDGMRPRVSILHWGRHEQENGFEHCETVILAGLLHRSHLDIAAAIKGQSGSLATPTPSPTVRRVLNSEVAHAVYQAASRGSCRRVEYGKAMAMRLYLFHASRTLEPLLNEVMPGAQWTYTEPTHLPKAIADHRAADLLGHILEYLRTVPESVNCISSTKLKAAMRLPKEDQGANSAFKRAIGMLDVAVHGWERKGRSVVRSGVWYGFQQPAN